MAKLEAPGGDHHVLFAGESREFTVRLAPAKSEIEDPAAAPLKIAFATTSDGLVLEPAEAEIRPGQEVTFKATLPAGERRHAVTVTLAGSEEAPAHHRVVFNLRALDPATSGLTALAELARDLAHAGGFADSAFGRRTSDDLRAVQRALAIVQEKVIARADQIPDERMRALLMERIAAAL